MTLQAVLDKIDGLSDELKKEYVAGTGAYDGKFVLDVAQVGDMELTNASGLKSALTKERDARAAAEKTAKAFEGLDAAAAKIALEKVKTMDDWDPEKKLAEHKVKFETETKARIESERDQIVKKHVDESAEKDKVNEGLTGQLKKALIDAAVKDALVEHGGTELLEPHIRSQVEMRAGDDGVLKAVVIDANKSVRISPASGSTANMSISEVVAEMKGKDAFAAGFQGSKASGGGAPGGGVRPGPSGTRVVSRDDQVALGDNLADIASGKVTVED